MSIASDARRAASVDFATDDPAAARKFLRPYLEDHRYAATGDRSTFRMRATSDPVDAFEVQTFEHSLTVDAVLRPRGVLMVAHLLAGRLEIDRPDGQVRLLRGQTYLYQAQLAARLHWSAVRLGVISLDLHDVEAVATELSGIDAAQLRFHDGRAVSTSAERYWQAVVRLVNRDVLSNELAVQSPLVQASVGRVLTVALLETFPNTAMNEPYVRSADGHVPPSAMRRAVAFIDANAARPLSMGDIAAAARVTPRSLQHSFRRVWDTTPTEYLRRVRLERAHRDLQAGDPTQGDTVAAIAARWGFGHVGRFATRYRAAYGRTPNEILRS